MVTHCMSIGQIQHILTSPLRSLRDLYWIASPLALLITQFQTTARGCCQVCNSDQLAYQLAYSDTILVKVSQGHAVQALRTKKFLSGS